MVTNDDLYGIAERRGHVVVCESLTETPSLSLQTNKRCYIAIDQRLNVQQEREALAHELGHCEYGGFYNRSSRYDIRAKAERRADKWAFAKLVPYGQLMQAVRHGVTEVWDLAELFDVSCEFMQRAIAYYKTAIL
ncbi:MAG: ImmA/IrrE family metallo-endopeptidase [Candidatus Limiplasma sp.]|nr:ImmA/IrrE family metallo-endopeptidase [Candidatus Limiplasma sp.]